MENIKSLLVEKPGLLNPIVSFLTTSSKICLSTAVTFERFNHFWLNRLLYEYVYLLLAAERMLDVNQQMSSHIELESELC